MTREEAIKILKAIRVYACYPKSASEETKEAIDMAIETLSAEATTGDYPNDLISRSALMEYCSNQKSKSIDNNDIARFPSAEARPTGEWIQDDDYICDQCGYHMIVGGGAYNFCPNCGARMTI